MHNLDKINQQTSEAINKLVSIATQEKDITVVELAAMTLSRKEAALVWAYLMTLKGFYEGVVASANKQQSEQE